MPASMSLADGVNGGRGTGMRVLVTGASGRVGRATAKELTEHGHEVVGVDRVPPATPLPGRFVQVDLREVGQVAYAMQGCAAVVHLGAIVSPYRNPDELVFANNTQATYCALQAASLLGVKRAAIASSISSYGHDWAPEVSTYAWAPVDESYPQRPKDPYGLGKLVDEQTARMFCDRDGMTIAAFRFTWISRASEFQNVAAALRLVPDRPDSVRRLWTYVEVRDAARACRLAIEAAPFGFAAMNITAADTLLDLPTEEAIRRYAAETEIRSALPGGRTPFVLDRARRLIGWEPRHSWRDDQ